MAQLNDTTINGSLTIHGMEIIDLLHPIGSIHFTTTPIDVNSYLGCKWEQIADRFLVGAGNLYGSGATGGAARVTLQESEMPSHNHTQNAHNHTGWTGTVWLNKMLRYGTSPGDTGSGSNYNEKAAGGGSSHSSWNCSVNPGVGINNTTPTNNPTGGGQSHENLPPYLAVYIYKRIA